MSVPGFIAAANSGAGAANNGGASWMLGTQSQDPALTGPGGGIARSVRRAFSQGAPNQVTNYALYTIGSGHTNRKYVVRVYFNSQQASSVDNGIRGLWLGYFSVDSAGTLRFDGDDQTLLSITGAGIVVTGNVTATQVQVQLTGPNAGGDVQGVMYCTIIDLSVGVVTP